MLIHVTWGRKTWLIVAAVSSLPGLYRKAWMKRWPSKIFERPSPAGNGPKSRKL